jgi:AsmA protein
MSVKGIFNVKKDIPKSNVELRAKGINAGSLLKDLLKKDFLEGTARSKVAISMAGDDAEKIKSTLSGNGEFLFEDGAIVGIDLAGMVRNIGSTFGLAEKDKEKPRTDFSELHSPFTITKGVFNTSKTSMASPLIRVLAAGKADLVKETLDFRVEPKFVATLKGQGDSKQRAGITVPVLVTGNFDSPKFRPDLKGMVKKALGDPSKLKEMLKKPGSKETGESAPAEEKVKGLLKSLPFKR